METLLMSWAVVAIRLHRSLANDITDDIVGREGDSESFSQNAISEMPSIQGDIHNGDAVASPYLLSPSADAELRLLATNFLLYVAMVIITILIAKLYFPESLESRDPDPPSPRSYAYRIVQPTNPIDDDHPIDECVEEGDETEHLTQPMETLLSDPNESDSTTTSRDCHVHSAPSFSTRPSPLEFDQERLSKGQVFKRLVLCVVMLNLTFVSWGVLQERMLTRRYPRETGEYFTYSHTLVFTNRFWTLIMSALLWMHFKPRRCHSTVLFEYAFPSISNLLSSWCQYEALRYVSFPAATLIKSFKLAPVMAMGMVLGNKLYPGYDYLAALVIGLGITLFLTSTENLELGYDVHGQASSSWTGVLLLILYLLFDSFTSQWQSRMFRRHRNLSLIELMLATSAFSTALSFVTLMHTKELYPAITFINNHPEIQIHFFAYSLCSTIGQVFIFYTIKNFGAVIFALIMTARILTSIAISCILYGHQITTIGFVGLLLVMLAVLYRIKRQAHGQKLLRWQGMENDDGKIRELVHEWHEHADM